jgi:hypothetical protein
MANSAVDQPNRFLEQECISISVHFESLYPKKLTSWEEILQWLEKYRPSIERDRMVKK